MHRTTSDHEPISTSRHRVAVHGDGEAPAPAAAISTAAVAESPVTTCEHCGGQFQPRKHGGGSRQRFCGATCRSAGRDSQRRTLGTLVTGLDHGVIFIPIEILSRPRPSTSIMMARSLSGSGDVDRILKGEKPAES
jgi:hypothetical protein